MRSCSAKLYWTKQVLYKASNTLLLERGVISASLRLDIPCQTSHGYKGQPPCQYHPPTIENDGEMLRPRHSVFLSLSSSLFAQPDPLRLLSTLKTALSFSKFILPHILPVSSQSPVISQQISQWLCKCLSGFLPALKCSSVCVCVGGVSFLWMILRERHSPPSPASYPQAVSCSVIMGKQLRQEREHA